MARSYKEQDDLLDLIGRLIVIYFVILAIFYFSNRTLFWKLVIYGFIVIIIFFGIAFTLKMVERKRFLKLLREIRKSGQEDYIKNFINRFGFEAKAGKGFFYLRHNFEWDRIDDLEKVLLERGIKLKCSDKKRDIYKVLRFYIKGKEENLTRESIKKEPQKFASLSGSEFEKLLYRLFESMGYTVEWIGKAGDQDGDLIANKDGIRTLIQAKCYRDWSTGNAAVQQVVAAMKYYDCNKTLVVTTSVFTNEAIQLARANNTELVGKHRLQEMFLNYLGESWS